MSSKSRNTKVTEVVPSTDGVVSVSKPVTRKVRVKATPKVTKQLKKSLNSKSELKGSSKSIKHPSIFSPRAPIKHADILRSVDVERKGLAAVSKYAGLFFAFVGFAVSSVSLAGIYVEGIEMALNTESSYISRAPLTADTILATAEVVPIHSNANEKQGFSEIVVTTVDSENTLLSMIAHNATTIAFYAKTPNIVTERFLGNASEASSTEWSFDLNTTSLPTNEYSVFAKISTIYGTYVSAISNLRIQHEFNVGTSTINEEFDAVSKEINEAGEEYEGRDPQRDILSEMLGVSEREVVDVVARDVGSTTTSTVAQGKSDTSRTLSDATKEIQAWSAQEKIEFNTLVTELSFAVHMKNAYGIEDVKTRMLINSDANISKILSILVQNSDTSGEEYVSAFKERYRLLAIESIEREVKKQNFVYEKVGSAHFLDTDKDKLSDYDEYILNTSSVTADSDHDGFTDYYEIVGGSNPLDANNSTVIVNASLENAKLTSETFENDIAFSRTEDGGAEASTLSGTAPVGSFLSLFFPSVEHTVWVKTGDDGTWTFNLSNLDMPVGQHEAMVGLIDTNGVIKQLSKPVKFARTKLGYNSFRPLFHSEVVESMTTSAFSKNLLLLGYALTVLILGVSLLLLGLHLSYHSFKSSPKAIKV